MDVQEAVARVAAAHGGLVSWRLLLAAGLDEARARRAVAGLRRVHDGVFVTGHGPITDHQRWLAATLTHPGSVLSHASAAACWGMRAWQGRFEVITRPGSGGRRRIGDVLVCRSTELDGHVTERAGIPITTPARTALDLAPLLDERAATKLVREAVRLQLLTALELRIAVLAHPGRRGTALMREIATRFDHLPLARTKSDAEARAVEVLDLARRDAPAVNVWIAGEEADLSWADKRRIIEIDGPQWHLDPDEDARKTAAWRGAGWRVDRLPSDVPFVAPERLIALYDD